MGTACRAEAPCPSREVGPPCSAPHGHCTHAMGAHFRKVCPGSGLAWTRAGTLMRSAGDPGAPDKGLTRVGAEGGKKETGHSASSAGEQMEAGNRGQIFIKALDGTEGCWVLCVHHLDASSSPETYPHPPWTPCDDRRVEPSEFGAQR